MEKKQKVQNEDKVQKVEEDLKKYELDPKNVMTTQEYPKGHSIHNDIFNRLPISYENKVKLARKLSKTYRNETHERLDEKLIDIKINKLKKLLEENKELLKKIEDNKDNLNEGHKKMIERLQNNNLI